eukprot:jgi/Ulvmu1/8332/UM042_0038.1
METVLKRSSCGGQLKEGSKATYRRTTRGSIAGQERQRSAFGEAPASTALHAGIYTKALSELFTPRTASPSIGAGPAISARGTLLFKPEDVGASAARSIKKHSNKERSHKNVSELYGLKASPGRRWRRCDVWSVNAGVDAYISETESDESDDDGENYEDSRLATSAGDEVHSNVLAPPRLTGHAFQPTGVHVPAIPCAHTPGAPPRPDILKPPAETVSKEVSGVVAGPGRRWRWDEVWSLNAGVDGYVTETDSDESDDGGDCYKDSLVARSAYEVPRGTLTPHATQPAVGRALAAACGASPKPAVLERPAELFPRTVFGQAARPGRRWRWAEGWSFNAGVDGYVTETDSDKSSDDEGESNGIPPTCGASPKPAVLERPAELFPQTVFSQAARPGRRWRWHEGWSLNAGVDGYVTETDSDLSDDDVCEESLLEDIKRDELRSPTTGAADAQHIAELLCQVPRLPAVGGLVAQRQNQPVGAASASVSVTQAPSTLAKQQQQAPRVIERSGTSEAAGTGDGIEPMAQQVLEGEDASGVIIDWAQAGLHPIFQAGTGRRRAGYRAPSINVDWSLMGVPSPYLWPQKVAGKGRECADADKVVIDWCGSGVPVTSCTSRKARMVQAARAFGDRVKRLCARVFRTKRHAPLMRG